jgi:hypothetical protein
MTNSMDAISKKIQMAHATAPERRLAASSEEQKVYYDLYNDILTDLEALRGQSDKIGMPRTSDLLKKLRQQCDQVKITMEEELAKPR